MKRIGGGTAPQSFADMVEIYLPEKTFGELTVEAYHAGVSLSELDANLRLASNGGSISAFVPAGFTKTIELTSKDGSGALMISEDAKDYSLEVTSDGSSVSVPLEFPAFTPNRDWEHMNGTGAARIDLNLEGSSFAISFAPCPIQGMRFAPS